MGTKGTRIETLMEDGAEVNVVLDKEGTVLAVFNLPTEYTHRILPDLQPPKPLSARLKEGIATVTSLVRKLPPLRTPSLPLF